MRYAIALVSLVITAALALPLALAAIFFLPVLLMAAPFVYAMKEQRLSAAPHLHA